MNNNNSIEYRKKLNKSYKKCLNELFNPQDNWKDTINETKFTIDPILRKPKNTHTFILNYTDSIILDQNNNKHTYIFKRSHFYQKFKNQKSRIRQELVSYFNNLGFYVDLFKDERINKWCLKLSWNSNEIEDP